MIRGAPLLQNRWICGGSWTERQWSRSPLSEDEEAIVQWKPADEHHGSYEEEEKRRTQLWATELLGWFKGQPGRVHLRHIEDEGRWETHQHMNAAYMVCCIGNQEAPDEEYWWCRLCGKGADTGNCHCYCDSHLN